jgi:site-specific recombinase XerD
MAPRAEGRSVIGRFLSLMGLHGLRVSEVAHLEVGDLDLEAGTLRVVDKGQKERAV